MHVPTCPDGDTFTGDVEHYWLSWVGRHVFDQLGLLEILARHQLGLFDKEAKHHVGGDNGRPTPTQEFADKRTIVIRMDMGEKHIGQISGCYPNLLQTV